MDVSNYTKCFFCLDCQDCCCYLFQDRAATKHQDVRRSVALHRSDFKRNKHPIWSRGNRERLLKGSVLVLGCKVRGCYLYETKLKGDNRLEQCWTSVAMLLIPQVLTLCSLYFMNAAQTDWVLRSALMAVMKVDLLPLLTFGPDDTRQSGGSGGCEAPGVLAMLRSSSSTLHISAKQKEDIIH